MLRETLITCGVVLLLAGAGLAQPTFSIDLQGPTIGMPDGWFGAPITEGDILSPPLPGPPLGTPAPGPLPPPGQVIPDFLLGIMPGMQGQVELDALSYGRDLGGTLYFSVDEFAAGMGGPAPPNVWSEGATGNQEASADVFLYLGLAAPFMIPPGGPVIGNTAKFDGNGFPPTGLPGYGLIEPHPPTMHMLPDYGDNLDALDMDTTVSDLNQLVYFSLDSRFADPLEMPPVNSGTAWGNGFVGGDVLVSSVGGGPMVYAQANALGLDLVGGPDSDDLDALALFDDGDGVFDPAMDLIFFSVRRDSAVIGMPDSLWLAPIEEGDILTVFPGGLPAIAVPAEALGLRTMRTHGPSQFGPYGDELDAMDVVPEPGALAMILLGATGLVARRRRRR